MLALYIVHVMIFVCQILLLQNVNSGPALKTAGRGMPTMRGGRGESERGRGMGRGILVFTSVAFVKLMDDM